ncbi:Leucine rich repeat protein [Spraguea lophii 42_110]|uniref:Leucine rich repeat protein n=1 Tax=Spraguea lophii (strain 42_110) TaxID=1358809 RepID=S7XPX9_SPRLO|nr:Leucine rich repeat protein [Spraguea lophii 42_110]
MLFIFLLYFYSILSSEEEFADIINLFTTPENNNIAYNSLYTYYFVCDVNFKMDASCFKLTIRCNTEYTARMLNNIYLLSKVKELVLEYSRLITLPGSLGKMKGLISLNVGKNYFKFIPGCIFELENLKELNLEYNYISVINDEMMFLKNLRCLKLKGNLITKISPRLKMINELKTLNLDENVNVLRLSIINPNHRDEEVLFSSFPERLEYLSLVDIKLRYFPGIFSFIELRYLDLSNNFLVTLPLNFEQMKFLKILNLNGNCITQIDEYFGNLKYLTYLNLKSNNIKEFSVKEGHYNTLVSLNLDFNPTRKISFYKTSLTKLEDFGLTNIILEEFHIHDENTSTKYNLKSHKINTHPLKILNCKFGSFDYVEDTFKLNELIELSISCVLSDSIKTQDQILMKLSNLLKLEVLAMENCGLYKFPDQIFNLVKLKSLDLTSNRIKHLPSGIERLTLEVLNLQKNKLENIPSGIFKSKSLITLCLKDNKIIYLPKDIVELKFTIDLTENKLAIFGNENGNGLFDIPYYIAGKFELDEDQIKIDTISTENFFYQHSGNGKYNWNYKKFLKIKSQDIQEHSFEYNQIEILYNRLSCKITDESLRKSTLKYLQKVYQIGEQVPHISLAYGEQHRNILKKYIEDVLKTLHLYIENNDNLIEHCFLILVDAHNVCFDGQLEHLIEILKFLKNSDITSLENLIYNFISCYKYDALKRITSSNSSDQNVHILSYWRNELSNIFGFEKTQHLFLIDIENILLDSKPYILYQLYKELNAEIIINDMLIHINEKPELISKFSYELFLEYEDDLETLERMVIYNGDISGLDINKITIDGLLRILKKYDLIKIDNE